MDRISDVAGSAALDFVRPRDPMSLERLPNEILFMIFEWLLQIDPITLLGAIPGTTRRLRSIALNTLGDAPQDLRALYGYGPDPAFEAAQRELRFQFGTLDNVPSHLRPPDPTLSRVKPPWTRCRWSSLSDFLKSEAWLA